MSIAIPLGVTTPDTSYSDMAAGSEKEVEAPYLSRRSGTTAECESPAKETQGA